MNQYFKSIETWAEKSKKIACIICGEETVIRSPKQLCCQKRSCRKENNKRVVRIKNVRKSQGKL